MKTKKRILTALTAFALCLCCFATTASAAGAATQAQKDFIARVGAMASADMKQSGVLASLTVAQAILESGWGASTLTVKANALFGIKADARWKGRVYSITTQECYDGVTFVNELATFRAYDNWEHSLADHSAFLRASSRYAAVIGERDYRKACNAIQRAGYATDPGYANKLIKLIETYGLTAYDATNAFETYIVAKGDTLWNVAKKKLGKGGRYREIKSLNGLTGDMIRIGQKLKLPK
ncbi:MAG: glucosaminidase domain-containing protein [Oscillospiraceae bacterium]|jgi:flagellar rod assembly protein/muramidase FlgJ|nr:glucosaminidase domain-containing protein [Oscillospiraceae bacterium]